MHGVTWSEWRSLPACGSRWSEWARHARRRSCSAIRFWPNPWPEAARLCGPSAASASGGAGRGEARDRDAAAALPDLVAIEAVGAVGERQPARRIRPSDVPARAAVPEGRGRVGFAEAAEVSLAVVAGDHHAERAIDLVAEIRIGVIAGAPAQRFREHLRR